MNGNTMYLKFTKDVRQHVCQELAENVREECVLKEAPSVKEAVAEEGGDEEPEAQPRSSATNLAPKCPPKAAEEKAEVVQEPVRRRARQRGPSHILDAFGRKTAARHDGKEHTT